MNKLLRTAIFIAVLLLLTTGYSLKAQFLMDMVDTTKEMGKGLLSIYKKYDHIRISGYMQPQFQVTQSKGAKTYSGGDFASASSSRFMLRRGRIRFDYIHFSENTKPSVQFVFQFDGTERGVVIRDFWGRIFENNVKLFSLTTGMFARPFGYEVNLSSSDREAPERGRMSQILMKTERDMGAMISLEPRDRTNWLKYIKLDAGIFNGQGLTAPAEYDSYKDFITRASLKPYPVKKNLLFSTGLSYFNGGLIQNNKYYYTVSEENNPKHFTVDSSQSNVGRELSRKYYGADAQLKWLHAKSGGATELRAEYWWGKQTASANISETPAILLLTDAFYTRSFDGAFLQLLHSFDKHNQVAFKYDWYDPNTQLAGNEITSSVGAHTGDIKYNTFGLGYIHYFDDNLKLVTWYDFIRNEATALDGYTKDLEDNVLTLRLQFRF